MAKPGRKPKPVALRVVDNNPGKRALPEETPGLDGSPVKPTKCKGRASALWDEYIAPAYWLTESDSFTAYMWCSLAAEFERSPKNMVAGRIAQVRALGNELGLDPSSRTRLAPKGNGKKSPNGKYFD